MTNDKSFLPYGRHTIEEDDITAVADLMRSGEPLTGGGQIHAMESEFSAYVQDLRSFDLETIITSNGTSALHLAAIGAGIGQKDKVIVPSITFLATANVVRMQGGDVIFADVCPDTGLLTPKTFLNAIEKTNGAVKAVFPVHMNGQSCLMDEIQAIAKAHNIKVVTDCCHALGADYMGNMGKIGNGHYEDFACFSLHPVKSIAMGEGGAVATRNKDLANRLRQIRSHDMNWNTGGNAPWDYEMHVLGYNYRATDLQCALGRSQLKKLDRFIQRRREIAELYDRFFQKKSNHIKTLARNDFSQSAWHLYPIFIDFKSIDKSRQQVMQHLKQGHNVGTQVHYKPVHTQPYYTNLYGLMALSGADEYYGKTLSLPIYPAMSDADVARVCNAVMSVVGV